MRHAFANILRNRNYHWNRFKKELPLLGKLQILRIIFATQPARIELHEFWDASQNSYKAVVYVTVEDCSVAPIENAELIAYDRWLFGLPWLARPHEFWPTQPTIGSLSASALSEARVSANLVTAPDIHHFNYLLDRISSFGKILRTRAYVFWAIIQHVGIEKDIAGSEQQASLSRVVKHV